MDGPVFGAVVATGEEGVFPRQGLRAHGTLDDVGVNLDAAVVEEAHEALPVVEGVADDPGRVGLSRHSRKLLLEPGSECLDERSRLLFADTPAFIGASAAHDLLD